MLGWLYHYMDFRKLQSKIWHGMFLHYQHSLEGLKFDNIQLPLRLRSGFFLDESIWACAVLSCYLTLALNAWQSYLCFIPWSWFISIFTVIHLTNGRSTTEILVIFWFEQRDRRCYSFFTVSPMMGFWSFV